jgi:hypothetical protein
MNDAKSNLAMEGEFQHCMDTNTTTIGMRQDQLQKDGDCITLLEDAINDKREGHSINSHESVIINNINTNV